MNPDLLIIADEDVLYGVDKGYYPDITKAVHTGNLLVVSEENWRSFPLKLKTPPLCNGTDIYIRNPYTNCYIPASDNELLDNFVEEKSIAIKEAFVWLGAKDIVIDKSIEDKDTTKLNSELKANSTNNRGGSLNVSLSRITSVDIKTLIESHDPNRKPKSPEVIESFLSDNGLINDPKISFCLERLKVDGVLSGTEKYTLTYLNEVEFALKILASLDYKVFSSSLDFSLEHNHLHKFSESLSLTF